MEILKRLFGKAAGYDEATLVCERLQRSGKTDHLMSCLTALRASERGQECLAARDFEGVLKYSKEAAVIFEIIPEAKYLLAICKADISAAYGGLQDYKECARYAKDCIALVAGKKELILTEGSAFMNLGTASMHLGKPDDALTNLKRAYAHLSRTPKGTKYLSAIENNIEILEAKEASESSGQHLSAQRVDAAILKDATTCIAEATMWVVSRRDIGRLSRDERGYFT